MKVIHISYDFLFLVYNENILTNTFRIKHCWDNSAAPYKDPYVTQFEINGWVFHSLLTEEKSLAIFPDFNNFQFNNLIIISVLHHLLNKINIRDAHCHA